MNSGKSSRAQRISSFSLGLDYLRPQGSYQINLAWKVAIYQPTGVATFRGSPQSLWSNAVRFLHFIASFRVDVW
jgi:hypothetical protein